MSNLYRLMQTFQNHNYDIQIKTLAVFGCSVNLFSYLISVLERAPYELPSGIRSLRLVTFLSGTASSSLAGKFYNMPMHLIQVKHLKWAMTSFHSYFSLLIGKYVYLIIVLNPKKLAK